MDSKFISDVSPECKCAVELFTSRCVSHVADEFRPYLTEPLSELGLSLEQFDYNTHDHESADILQKVQFVGSDQDDQDDLVRIQADLDRINGHMCDLGTGPSGH
eukprot:SAG31_NODE_5577_length_2447_cov_1.805366_2_plen_104_part_00